MSGPSLKVVIIGTRTSNALALVKNIMGPMTTPWHRNKGYDVYRFVHDHDDGVGVGMTMRSTRKVIIELWAINTDVSYAAVADAAIIDADALVVCVAYVPTGGRLHREQLSYVKRIRNLEASKHVSVIATLVCSDSSLYSYEDMVSGRRMGPSILSMRVAWPVIWKIAFLPVPVTLADIDDIVFDRIRTFFVALFDELDDFTGDAITTVMPSANPEEALLMCDSLEEVKSSTAHRRHSSSRNEVDVCCFPLRLSWWGRRS